MSWKTPITLVVLLVVLGGAAYYGWKTVISPATDDKKTTANPDPGKKHRPTCQSTKKFKKGEKFKAKDTVVNVYNAGDISGLADDTMTALADKGFHRGQVSNAPDSVDATNVTILAANKQLPQVQLVASQFKGVIKYLKTANIAPGVDVIVGDNFAGMNTDAKKHIKLDKTLKLCVDVANS